MTDIAVWRPETGVWFILKSSDNYNSRYAQSIQWGKLGDVPVQADYDGDGKTDLAVYRTGVWYILDSSTQKFRTFDYGLASDIPLASLNAKISIVAVP